ncbi:MAG: class I SAM-dependent methyltransferase [Methanosarcinales archaeon]
MKITEETFKKLYEKHNENSNYVNFAYHLKNQLSYSSLSRKKLLEIGCGKGFTSLWISCFTDIEEVWAIDEAKGAGSELNVLNNLKEIVDSFKIDNLKICEIDFLHHNFQNEHFDYIIANNTLHHIIRTRKYYSKDHETKKQWIDLFKNIYLLLKNDGILILGELTRKSIWRFLPLKYRNIDWKIHPTLSEFLDAIKKAGFLKVDYQYRIPYQLRKFNKILNNYLFGFFVRPSLNIFAKK